MGWIRPLDLYRKDSHHLTRDFQVDDFHFPGEYTSAIIPEKNSYNNPVVVT